MLACKTRVPPAGRSSSDDVSLSSSPPNKLSSDSSSSLSKSFYYKKKVSEVRIDVQLIKGNSTVTPYIMSMLNHMIYDKKT